MQTTNERLPENMSEAEIWGDMARQTEQAKLLREARDKLAGHVRELADRKNRQTLKAMGFAGERVSELCAGAEFNSADLASLLGVSLPTLRNWLSPTTSKVHREMPQTAKLLLARLLDDIRK